MAPSDDAISRTVAERLGVSCEPLDHIDPERIPLVFAERPPVGQPRWKSAVDRVNEERKGAVFMAWCSVGSTPDADVVGGLEDNGVPLALEIDAAQAIVMAQHPVASIAGRELIFQVSTLQPE